MNDKRMRWAASALVALGALASGCAHRSTAISEGTTSALMCDRARSEAEANAVRQAGARQAAATNHIAARASYDAAVGKSWADGRQYRTPGRQTHWGRDFQIRENHWAEQCRLAREREREAELERKQNILTPPR